MELTNPEIKADEDDLNYEPQARPRLHESRRHRVDGRREADGGRGEVYDVLKSQLDAVLAEYGAIETKDLPEFNRAAEAAGLGPAVPSPKLRSRFLLNRLITGQIDFLTE